MDLLNLYFFFLLYKWQIMLFCKKVSNCQIKHIRKIALIYRNLIGFLFLLWYSYGLSVLWLLVYYLMFYSLTFIILNINIFILSKSFYNLYSYPFYFSYIKHIFFILSFHSYIIINTIHSTPILSLPPLLSESLSD